MRDLKKNFKRFFFSSRKTILNCFARQRAQNDRSIFPRPLWERKSYRQKVAFTLAEILITLGIIGIVAAMTIPTLISNYNKKQTVTRLKQSYSILSQALSMAQAEHGDPTTWSGLSDIYGSSTANVNKEEVLTNFVHKYFMPYVKVSNDLGFGSRKFLGYSGPYFPLSNTLISGYGSTGYGLILSNNVFVFVILATDCVNYDDNDVCIEREFRNLAFSIDINGFSKPNVYGKDVFLAGFDLNKRVFYMYGSHTNRNSALESCKTDDGSQFCGRLIFFDGWQIKEDYPWY